MALASCRECQREVHRSARKCPYCRAPNPARADWQGTGRDWKSRATLCGYPLIHIAYGRNAQGKLRVAKGVIAIGQFAIGLIAIAQVFPSEPAESHLTPHETSNSKETNKCINV